MVDNAEQTCFMTEDEVKSSVVSQSRVGQRKLKLVTARRNLDCQRKTYHIMYKWAKYDTTMYFRYMGTTLKL